MKRIRVFAVILLGVTLSVTGCSGPGGKAPEKKPATSVVITNPAPYRIVRTIRFAGTLKGSREVMVYPTLPGKIIGYARSDGDYVSKGGTVATIDRDVPGVEYEPVPVEAPISGRFFSMGLSPGEMVAPQMPIGRVSETGNLKLDFTIPEKYINSVKQGSRAEVAVPSLDYSVTGTLTRVSRFIDARSGGAQAEATVSNPSGTLAPGMHAEVEVEVASRQANLALPIDCVLGLDGRFVYVVEDIRTVPDTSFVTRQTERGKPLVDTTIKMIDVGIAVKRNVEVGLDNSSFIEIVSGLEPEDDVLYVGQRIVEEQGKVRITGTYDFSGD
ncbi:HlyD family efflux transporter periplasmic adaptor subunit [candidate division WOR-3 bacterium]|nr:HlyD family efflux transporter periplasmic adaptor subunit [candidate division WOR-3 bacterium]